MRQLISIFLATALGLASTHAYLPNAEQTEPAHIQAAILLGEDGTPRCRIGDAPELDDLRECDEGDELYARMILGDEEISLGAAFPPGKTFAAFLANTVVMSVSGCIFSNWLDHSNKNLKYFAISVVGVTIGYLPALFIAGKILSGFALTSSFHIPFGAISGSSFGISSSYCNDTNETTTTDDE